MLSLLLPSVRAAEQSKRGTTWGIDPWLNVATGYEDESLVDPSLGLGVVPGGPFVNFTPGARIEGWFSPKTSLTISATGSAERYFNEEQRLLIGLSTWGEFNLRSSGPLYGRLTLGADFFDDSEFATLGRVGASGQAAVGLGGRRGGAELIAGGRGRRYPDLVTEDDAGVAGVYSEITGSVGAAAFGYPGRSLFLRGQVTRLATDARDPLFDSTSWYLQGDARVAVGRSWAVWFAGNFQGRRFQNRLPAFDEDDYLQAGVRVFRFLKRGRRLGLSYSYVRYGLPGGDSDTSNRISLLFFYPFGRTGTPTAMRLDEPPRQTAVDPQILDGIVRFRLRAPDATTVAVAADFNGWDPEANSLARSAGGSWELALQLPPGSYQYVYVVDGEWITPPRAAVTLDDGFGGTNGLFKVENP